MKPRQPLPRISKKRLAANGGKTPFLKRSAIRKKPRKPSETLRIYGGKKRIAWIKALTCWYRVHFSGFSCAGEIQNAHTVTGGTGRKADANTIIPLCASHHWQYDHHEAPFDTDGVRALAILDADFYEREWLAFSGIPERGVQNDN